MGVTKVPAPQATLEVYASVIGGDLYVMTTSPDNGFLISYSN
ncbi:MAG: hypothetical protein ACP5GU_02065 [Thermoprotei archaeon]